MQIQQHIQLATMTSFGVGGRAEQLITITSHREIDEALAESGQPLWLLGHGTNVLISDHGLSGTTLRFGGGEIEVNDSTITADAGASWDALVLAAIRHKLWGVELLSGVPGSVGAANFINIAAYGQSNNDRLKWLKVYNLTTNKIEELDAASLEWGYKQSLFQEQENYIILQASYELSKMPTQELEYQSALDVAQELDLNPKTLNERREIIIKTRERAGSIFVYGQNYAKTVGSFFRNPDVTPQQAELVMAADESGKTREQVESMNRLHGGSNLRVSAAHVMLAAGFKRGQSWGAVRLHPDHVLKIENTGGASAQEIYEVAQEIIRTCRDKVGITLEPEARILGEF